MNRLRASAMLALGAAASSVAGALDYRLEASGLRVGGVEIERIEIRAGEGRRTEQGVSAPTVRVDGLSMPGLLDAGDATLSCADPVCARGRLTWRAPGAEPLSLDVVRAEGKLRATADSASLVLEHGPERWSLTAADVPLGWLARLAPAGLRPAALSGRLDGAASNGPDGFDGRLVMTDAAFDTTDGRYAAAGLGAELAWQPAGQSGTTQLSFAWRSGELLLGPAYLPPPDPAMTATARISPTARGWRIDPVAVEAGDALAASGSACVVTEGEALLEALDVDEFRAELEWLWQSGMRSLAGAVGWGGLSPRGRLSGRFALRGRGLESARLELAGVDVDDEQARLRLSDARARVEWRAAGSDLAASLGWSDARVYAVPLGETAAALSIRSDGRLALEEAWRVPVLDGALVIEQLAWRDWKAPDRELQLSARLEAIDLAGLTETLGWPAMGGSVAGRFPGLRVGAGVAEFSGGLQLDLFDGRARVANLKIERPFGTLPALSADATFERLDLEPLTRTFEFGRMTGRASGHVRDLRLLDWRPVRFDAWIETLVDVPDRVISQQAVDSLSQVAGGGAAMSGLVLNWFDRFPYRKAGLGCELAGDVCTMRGLGEADNGGYVILEGRGIPRLDIIGHQRRVDFSQLLAQLSAAGAAE